MKKIFSFLLFLFFLSPLFSLPEVYFSAGPEVGYTTNMFSNPLPQSGSQLYLENISFLARVNTGLSVKTDLFFTPRAKAGISQTIQVRFPVYAIETKVDDPSSTTWNYVTNNALSYQIPHFFYGFGVAFRQDFGRVEICLDARVTIGSFDYFTTGFIVGLQTDIFVNTFLTGNLFISTGLVYDAHLFKMLDESLPNVYQEGFTMLTIGGFVTIGWAFGRDND